MMKKYGIWILTGVSAVLLSGVAVGREFADRAPRVDREQLEAVAAEVKETQEQQKPATLDERMDVVEDLVARLYRITDPFDHRDEMRLERRVRDLEDQVERLEREIRRLETQVRR